MEQGIGGERPPIENGQFKGTMNSSNKKGGQRICPPVLGLASCQGCFMFF